MTEKFNPLHKPFHTRLIDHHGNVQVKSFSTQAERFEARQHFLWGFVGIEDFEGGADGLV